MTTHFGFWDYFIFIAYAVLILGVGLWVSRDKKGHQKNAEDYFLASKSLPWWAFSSGLDRRNSGGIFGFRRPGNNLFGFKYGFWR